MINWAVRAKPAGLSFLIVNLGVPWAYSYQIIQCSRGIVLKGKPECHNTNCLPNFRKSRKKSARSDGHWNVETLSSPWVPILVNYSFERCRSQYSVLSFETLGDLPICLWQAKLLGCYFVKMFSGISFVNNNLALAYVMLKGGLQYQTPWSSATFTFKRKFRKHLLKEPLCV